MKLQTKEKYQGDAAKLFPNSRGEKLSLATRVINWAEIWHFRWRFSLVEIYIMHKGSSNFTPRSFHFLTKKVRRCYEEIPQKTLAQRDDKHETFIFSLVIWSSSETWN